MARRRGMKTTDPGDAARIELLPAELRLPTIKQLWAALAAEADKEGWPAARLLAALLDHETAARGRRRIERHLAEARLPPGKTLDSFEFEAVPRLSKAGHGPGRWRRVARVGTTLSPNSSPCRASISNGSRHCRKRCATLPAAKPSKPLSTSISVNSPTSNRRVALVVTKPVLPNPALLTRQTPTAIIPRRDILLSLIVAVPSPRLSRDS
jgi:hypothetical protein